MGNKDNLGDNIEKGYHSILRTVEDLVEKEGKNIKEAFADAEEKLSEWSELGREETSKISKEVFHDLSSLGETIEEAKDSFKQKWQLDSKYLSDSTWKTLSSVADKTTLALMEFRNGLQEHVDEATKDLHQREHQGHSDHEIWQGEIKSWTSEYEQAVMNLAALQETIQHRIKELKEHENAISTHGSIDQVHEKDISHSEQDSDSPVLDVIKHYNEEAYEERIERHKSEATTHKKLKDDYHQMMVLIAKCNK